MFGRREKTYVRINGKTVDAEVIPPDEIPFIANPQVRDTAMFVAGVGLGGYRLLRNLAGVSLNPPTRTRVHRAMPWTFISAIAFVLAPAFGKGKNLIRIGGALLGLKAVNELVRKVHKEEL